MRVLLTNHFPYHGSGTGTYVRDLATLLGERGHEVRALIVDRAADSSSTPSDRNDPCPTARITFGMGNRNRDLDFDFPCFTAHPYSSNTFARLTDVQLDAYLRVTTMKLQEVVESFHPQIIHCQHIWVQPSALRGMSVPYVISAQGTDIIGYKEEPRLRSAARNAAVGAARIIAASKFIRTQVVTTFPGMENKTNIVVSAIDTSIYDGYKISRQEALSHLGLPADVEQLVVFMGKLVYFKGPDVMLRAAAIYGLLRPEITTVFCGSGPLLPELERSAARIKDVRIRFLGDRSILDRAALLSLANLVVMPSREEPLGLVALEAMASATPVVASRSGGLPEIVDDITGGLVRPDHPIDLAKMVMRAITEDWKALKGAAARSRVRIRLSPETWVKSVEQIYREIVKSE